MITPSIALLFCKTDLVLSRLIMWGGKTPCSHLGIDCPRMRDIIHSDLVGVHLAPRQEFLDAHTIVASIKVWLDPAAQQAVEAKLAAYMNGLTASYDYGAFAYLALAACWSRASGRPLPRANPWSTTGEYICTEAAFLLNQAIVEVIGKPLFSYSTELGAMLPWQLYQLLNPGGKGEIDLRTAVAGAPG